SSAITRCPPILVDTSCIRAPKSKRCREIRAYDWIIARIAESPRLRMMVPRLYGLIDLESIMDRRAYRQAQLILSEMGDNLQKLVVTDAHRRSVGAISDHSVVLLLGSPAAGKSTIGASLALGANDIWKCSTIKSTSPEHLEKHLDSKGSQFFWIDDAWGSTQYQRDRVEAWNQIFPLMQGALKRGTRFLLTSRDYIWNSAKAELKLQAFPILRKSQVVINVHDLTLEEKARILYNHLKLGDQPKEFRRNVKRFLPKIAQNTNFLPESARRLGTILFTESLIPSERGVIDFFERPTEFLEQTIENLSPEAKAAIALIFLNGGVMRSPVSTDKLTVPATAFGVTSAQIRNQLQALNGSLLNLAEDEDGPYWTYRHPTVSDAFAAHVAKSPELVEVYLTGAKPETIVSEVVCAGIQIYGASVVVPPALNELLVGRISSLGTTSLVSFICYRSNSAVTRSLVDERPDLKNRIRWFSPPLKDDLDVEFVLVLHRHGLLSEEERLDFVEAVRRSAVDDADDSFIEMDELRAILEQDEFDDILLEVRDAWMSDIDSQVQKLQSEWSSSYDPADYFDRFKSAVSKFTTALGPQVDEAAVKAALATSIRSAEEQMYSEYEETPAIDAPLQQSQPKSDSLEDLFRDIDD
ncbi:hypothetical protein, partial [Bradyrhizobium sp. LA2.1]|uniref:nSTAND3 domain-containing NTPase n=1 Tax=Bradyrhizobium sp. LA2.1 TaxID=3156376 RepID=UPI003399BD6B